MVSPIEIAGRRNLIYENGRVRGEKTFYANWVDKYAIQIPHDGDQFDDEHPWLICTGARMEETDAAGAEIIATYVDMRELQQDSEFIRKSLDISGEALDTTRSMVWEDTGMPVDIPISTIHVLSNWNITMYKAAPPEEQIWSCIGKVNDRRFHRCPPETLLFLGASTDETIGFSGNIMAVSTVYRFQRREQSHNLVFRPALQKRDKHGVLLYWHDDPKYTTDRYYTTDTTKIGTPVYVDGAAGTAGWTKPKDPVTAKYRYDLADFHTILDIPEMAGDGLPAP